MPQVIANDLRERLLASIAGNSLIAVCGAGLSMAPPSRISSAWQVARSCAHKYSDDTGAHLTEELSGNIELLARHFFEQNQLEQVLLKRLIDWSEFIKKPFNAGHLAIADFLASKVCALVLSTNLDTLIESAADALGEPDIFPIVFENDLNLNQPHSPLLKIHGCARRSRYESLWCKEQLKREPLKSRLPTLIRWLQHYVPNRDLLVVGFWTDWSYLNNVLEKAVVSTEPRSVIVVDPSSDEQLEAKSPALWKWAKKCTKFIHVQCSGDSFLDELRCCVSRQHIMRVWQKGATVFEQVIGAAANADHRETLATLSVDDLYGLRRDLTGRSSISVVRDIDATESQATIGAVQLALLDSGAEFRAHHLNYNGESIRLLHTPARPLSAIKRDFATEPPDPMPATRTVCVGAIDDGGAPENIMRKGIPQGIIRNSNVDQWETHDRILTELRRGI